MTLQKGEGGGAEKGDFRKGQSVAGWRERERVRDFVASASGSSSVPHYLLGAFFEIESVASAPSEGNPASHRPLQLARAP